jgi:plasmid maintenance system killer protein
MQRDQTYLARTAKSQVSQRHSESGASQTPATRSAATVEALRNPPGNRLEALKGDRAGQMSIRINDQWRICFRWSKGDADDVEIADYHSSAQQSNGYENDAAS